MKEKLKWCNLIHAYSRNWIFRNVDALLFDCAGKNASTRFVRSVCSNKWGVFLYQFSDFASVQALPDVVTVPQLSQAIGLSPSRTYELLDEARIPYLRIYKRKIIFKEHLLQGLSNNRIFTDVAGLNAIKTLPEVFSPKHLITALGVSNGFAYTLVRSPGFPAVMQRDRIIISKQGFIRWIRSNELYIGKEGK